MRVLHSNIIRDTTARLCARAHFNLRPDILALLKAAYKKEKKRQPRDILCAIIENAAVARRRHLAICQDTGMPAVFLEVGQELGFIGDVNKAVQRGVEAGYQRAYLRNSVVPDPLSRGRPRYGPAIIHTEIKPGKQLRITVLPKGFGCENKTGLAMFNPTASVEEIKRFIVKTVEQAGPDACPPYIVGVGIGGTADYACLLAKKALLKNFLRPNKKAGLEQELLKEINRLNIGPMGLGGSATALAVSILKFPTHIAGLPVCVNISCHALRSATARV